MTTQATPAQGTLLKIGDGASPEVFTTIVEVVDFTGPGGQASVIDATTLESTAREKVMGLPDEGQFSFNGFWRLDDPAVLKGLRADRAARTLRNFTLTLADTPGSVITFAGYVLGVQLSGGVDQLVQQAITIEITGALGGDW